MRLIKAIFMLPFFVCLLPASILISMMILVGETEAGTLRSLLNSEIRNHGVGKGYRQFMAKIFVPGYKNIIQSFVLVGAGLLIIAVGLRTLTTLPLEAVYAALGLEYTLLLMWAVTVYYTDDSEMQTASATGAAEARSATTEVLIHSMEQLTFSVALLENRLRTTEGRFDKFSKLDSSLENLASELELLTTEQIGVRVRQEFERMIAEVSTRVLNKNGDGEATLSRLKGGSSLGRASASSW